MFLCAGIAVAWQQEPAGQPGSQLPRGGQPPPDFPPSYQVHISPTGMANPETSSTTVGNYWVARGWDLKSMIAEAWHVDESRLEISTPVATGKRYDFAMVLPQPEERETIYKYVQQAIQDEFHVRIERESQAKDVYVLTAPTGLSPAVRIQPKVAHGGFGSNLNMSDHSLSAHGITMEQLCHVLERRLGRLVVDETKVDGRIDVEVQGEGQGLDARIAMLRDKVGLVLTPDHREVEMLVVR